MEISDKIQQTAKRLVTMLVAHHFAAFEAWSNEVTLKQEHMHQALREYPGSLVMPPGSTIPHLNVIAVTNTRPTRWSVDIPLWTEEEGRSALTLQVTMMESANELMDVEIDNIHVP